ncbi:MAG: HAD-IC family P-type ATPase, partial [Bacteroidota bacterium]
VVASTDPQAPEVPVLPDYYQLSLPQLTHQLRSKPNSGLTEAEANKRLKKYGPNQLETTEQKPLWRLMLEQFSSPLVWILVVAAVLAFSFQETLEGIAILVVILINAAIGFFMERQAIVSMQALSNLTKVRTVVLRNGKKQSIAAHKLTPGDVVLLEAGDMVTADCRLLEEHNLAVNESALTGESIPIRKTTDPIAQAVPASERKNTLFKGTTVVRGNARAMVCVVGQHTELGRIASLTKTAQKEATPLEAKLNKLSHKLLGLTILLAVLVFVIGWWQGRPLLLMIKTSIALAIAAIPEGLPIVATIALARGMLRLAGQQVIVKKLSAVETLGETQVIFTDKTGTLTENEMQAGNLCFEYGAAAIGQENRLMQFQNPHDQYLRSTFGFRQMMHVSTLCNNAALAEGAEGQNIG